LHQPSAEEQRILSHIPYQTNRAYVHHDPALMPKRTACWASWNYMCDEAIDERARISVTYWMNRLQGIDKRHPIFVTLNPSRPPKEEFIVEQTSFEHPVYSMDMLAAQKEMPQIQGIDRIWYCGAYQRYGFHEDGLHSAVEVAKQLGCATPW
ncbi:MAG: NAD/FAD-binding protein, partial [Alphaproteobacteria bacterium]